MIDVEALRQKAVAVQQQRQNAKNDAEYAEKQRIAAKANDILAKVETLCNEAAEDGRRSVEICKVDFSDIDWPRNFNGPYNECDPETLNGHCRIVYDYLNDVGLNPMLDFWHDGTGMEGGFKIFARF